MTRARLDFIYFDAGGGHRAAATALRDVIGQQGLPWDVRLVNLQEVLDSLDVFRKVTGYRLQDLYNLLLIKGWTLGAEHMLKVMHAVIRWYHPAQVRLLKDFWASDRPDIVVSLVPNFNRAMFQALEELKAGIPYVTILTDMADYPPHFWIEAQKQYLICGTERAAEQARAIGCDEERLFLVSGMILRPAFYEPQTADRRAERIRLGLQADLPTGLVLFGGHGSPAMLEIARRLNHGRHDLQLIFICGRNDKLAAAIRALPAGLPRLVTGFTTEVPYYMHLSDFLIGKPGPGSISEALAMKLPVVVERNAWTLPQERFNVDWLVASGAGLAVPGFGRIGETLDELLSPGRLETLRRSAAGVNNRAVFEITGILERLLTAA